MGFPVRESVPSFLCSVQTLSFPKMIKLCNQRKYQEKEDPLIQETLLLCPFTTTRRESTAQRYQFHPPVSLDLLPGQGHVYIHPPMYKRKYQQALDDDVDDLEICVDRPIYENVEVIDEYGNCVGTGNHSPWLEELLASNAV